MLLALYITLLLIAAIFIIIIPIMYILLYKYTTRLETHLIEILNDYKEET